MSKLKDNVQTEVRESFSLLTTMSWHWTLLCKHVTVHDSRRSSWGRTSGSFKVMVCVSDHVPPKSWIICFSLVITSTWMLSLVRQMPLRYRGMLKIFFIICAEQCDARQNVEKFFNMFSSRFTHLELTTQFLANKKLRFQSLELLFRPKHVCWKYVFRCRKILLPLSSAHSALIKRGMAKSGIQASLSRYCHHLVKISFQWQVARLTAASFADNLLSGVAESLLAHFKKEERSARQDFCYTFCWLGAISH